MKLKWWLFCLYVYKFVIHSTILDTFSKKWTLRIMWSVSWDKSSCKAIFSVAVNIKTFVANTLAIILVYIKKFKSKQGQDQQQHFSKLIANYITQQQQRPRQNQQPQKLEYYNKLSTVISDLSTTLSHQIPLHIYTSSAYLCTYL